MSKTQTYLLVGGGLVLAYLLFFRTSTVKLGTGSSSTTAKVSALTGLINSVEKVGKDLFGSSTSDTSSSDSTAVDIGS